MRSQVRAGAVALGLAVSVGMSAPADAAPPPRSLYVTNIASNDVSGFAIGPAGALRLRAERAATVGGARGIVVTPDGRTMYVANGGDPVTGADANAITAYRVSADGGLTPLDPPTAANHDPDGLAIAPGGRMLYAVNRGSATVSAFAVAADGRLSPRGTPVPSGDENPRAVALTPDGRFAYVTNGDPLDDTPDLLTEFAVRADGTLRRIGQVRIGTAGGVPAITADGRFLYVPCASGQVFGFAITADGGLDPVPGSPVAAPDVPIQAAVTPDGRHLYVTDGGLVASTSTKVSRFDIGRGGALAHRGDSDAGAAPVALTPTPDGRHLYVSNINSDDVSAFGIQPTGDLRKIADFPTGGEQPALQSIAVRPDQGPIARFGVQPGRQTRFDARASSDRDGHVARFDWDFGDGASAPNAGPGPVHVYRHPGVFRVTLSVTDDEGCGDRLVFTGTSALCNGMPIARTTRYVTIGHVMRSWASRSP